MRQRGGNMKTLGKLVVLLLVNYMGGKVNCQWNQSDAIRQTIANISVAVQAETGCGSLEERLLYSKDESTEPSQYPWMGLLVHRNGQNVVNARCSVVIVGEQHVLTPASCVRSFNDRPGNVAVRLGIWNESHLPDEEYICNESGFCVPGPVQMGVVNIMVHPLADKDTGDYDLAILKLDKRITQTAYLQPICLQPTSEPATWINKNLHYGGFEENDQLKGKGLAIVISRQYCTELSEMATPPPENQFCGYPAQRTTFYKGAGLLGINVERDVPHSFYLVGLLVRVVDVGQTTVFFFQDLKNTRLWIIDNTR